MTPKGWLIFKLNLCWAIACAGALWYILREMDTFYVPFVFFYIILGWTAGIVTGLCNDES